MSGPKYGEARLDMKIINELMAELNGMLENGKISKINQEINLIRQGINDILDIFHSENSDLFISKNNEKLETEPIFTTLKNNTEAFKDIAKDEFPEAFRSSDLIINQLLYQEKKNKLFSLVSQIQENKLACKQLLNQMSEIPLEEQLLNRKFKVPAACKTAVVSKKLMECYNLLLEKYIGSQDFIEIKKSADIILKDNSDDNYKISQLQMRMEPSNKTELFSKDYSKIRELTTEYTILAEQLGLTHFKIPTKITILESEISALKEKLGQMKMSEYISNSINKVMDELGYNVIGKDIINTETQNMEKTYYDFSDTSALNVATSNSGAILFEVMGKEVNLSMGQKQLIKNDMDKFCPDYYEIKNKLEAYGVYLENEKYCKADVKYVRGGNISKISTTNERRKNEKKGMIMSE